MGIADSTRLFWQSAGPRLGHLLLPYRRLVLDSRRQPLTLQGHFSRHWLVLLSDILVDVGYNTVTTQITATRVCRTQSKRLKYAASLSRDGSTIGDTPEAHYQSDRFRAQNSFFHEIAFSCGRKISMFDFVIPFRYKIPHEREM